MPSRRDGCWLVLGAMLLAPAVAPAATIEVVTGEGALAAALAAAAPGDTLRLAPGRHEGPVTITKPLTLQGVAGAIVQGDGDLSVITVAATDVTIRGLTVTGSGLSLEDMDAGIFLTPEADRALIEANRIENNLIGVNVRGPEHAVVRRNTILGRTDLRMNERGNGVHLWNTPGTIVAGNDIRFGRDGIFVTTSEQNAFRGNRFRDLRFAVHYMYTNQSEVSGNLSLGNHLGYALMFSTGLDLLDNVSSGDRDHGIMLNYANGARIERNLVEDGGEKCVFIYNSNKNRLADNHFQGCEIGVHFTAGSERNVITGNAFVDNRTQVKYVGSRWLDWSENGRGNFWSDHPAFDLDGDGIADATYRPNDLVDQILWTRPLAKLLLNSPAVQLLRWAQSQFPALLPGGVVDQAPLMRPIELSPPLLAEIGS